MTITKEEKVEQLDRVLKGHALQGSENLKAFLRFVVMRGIESDEHQLKEYVIATEVFGRGSDYDSRVDSVVRVQAGRLRAKLQEYYTTDGRDDRILIDLPKGHYTPVFSYHRSANSEVPAGTGGMSGPEEGSLVIERQAAVVLWSELLRLPEPVLVVFSNSIFHGNYGEGMTLFKSLDSPETEAIVQGIGSNGQDHPPRIDHYTGIGEVMGVYFLGEFLAREHHPFKVKRSLLLTWDDAKTANIVVLGSPAENLFLLDLPQQQDFVFRSLNDDQQHLVNAIVNTNPQPGEQPSYLAKQYGPSPSQISEDYAVVSLLQGLSEKTRILILAGINTFGTQAAAEYVTRPEYIRDLIHHLNSAPPGQPPQLPAFYQILIKVNGGVPVQVSYVTHHVL